LTNSGNLSITNDNLITNDFYCNVVGSGNIEIHNLTNLNITMSVVGSGKIQFYDSKCNTAVVKIIGSGYIKTPTIKKIASCSITGSGIICCNIENNCEVTKCITGSGNVQQTIAL